MTGTSFLIGVSDEAFGCHTVLVVVARVGLIPVCLMVTKERFVRDSFVEFTFIAELY